MQDSTIERSVEVGIDTIFDELEHGMTVQEYYNLNHAPHSTRQALTKSIVRIVKQWLKKINR